MEKECPACSALNNVDGLNLYALIDCHFCGVALEFLGYELIVAKPVDLPKRKGK